MIDTRVTNLPIFQLAKQDFDRGTFAALKKEFDLEDVPETKLPEGGVRVAKGDRFLEATNDGAYWYADDGLLWNPAVVPTNLPEPNAAAAAAMDLLGRLNLLPDPNPIQDFKVEYSIAANTRTRSALARIERVREGDRESRQVTREPYQELDAYVGLRIDLRFEVAGIAVDVEVQGQGAKIGVVFGENSEKNTVIGLNASWRPIVGHRFVQVIWPPVAPEVRAPEDNSRATVVVTPHRYPLIYRRTVLADGTFLCPYWLFQVSIIDGDRSFRSMDVTTPAAEFGALPAADLALATRGSGDTPNAGLGTHAIGLSWIVNGNSNGDAETDLVMQQVTKAKWDTRFAWRAEDAWETDWSSDASRWVDTVDLAYYNGHATWYGWQLVRRGTGEAFLLSRTVGKGDSSGALWGNRLRWVMIAACGPLQDDCVGSPTKDVFAWAGAYDGFRLMMGFASVIAGFTGEGGRTLELARRGVPFARAWLRAAREAQPCATERGSGISRWAAVLAGGDARESALADVMPLGSATAAGALRADRLRAIWTPA